MHNNELMRATQAASPDHMRESIRQDGILNTMSFKAWISTKAAAANWVADEITFGVVAVLALEVSMITGHPYLEARRIS